MRNAMDEPPVSGSVNARLKEQFAPAYLTLTSIIQGVALAALVQRVESTFQHFDLADWLLAGATLVGFLTVWHEYLMQALAYVWLPTLLDSAVPFGFLVAELVMAHFVYGNQRAWLFASGVAFVVGIVAWGTNRVQARAQGPENAGVLRAVSSFSRIRLAFSVVPAALYLGTWALYDVFELGRVRLAVSVASLLIMILTVIGTVPYWNRILRYAQNERPAVSPNAG
jgi:hypothetical protein